MGFVGNYDDVGPIGKLRIGFAGSGAEFLDEGEDVAVVVLEELFEMVGIFGADFGVGFGDSAGIGEVFIDLVVEVFAIGDDEKGPVSGEFAEYFLAEKDHGVAFAAALGVPEDS